MIKLFQSSNLKPYRFYVIYSVLMLGIFIYCNSAGYGIWNMLTDDTQKWTPDGQTPRSSIHSSGTHFHRSTYFHK